MVSQRHFCGSNIDGNLLSGSNQGESTDGHHPTTGFSPGRRPPPTPYGWPGECCGLGGASGPPLLPRCNLSTHACRSAADVGLKSEPLRHLGLLLFAGACSPWAWQGKGGGKGGGRYGGNIHQGSLGGGENTCTSPSGLSDVERPKRVLIESRHSEPSGAD